jgi:hypothetical protein
MEYYSTLKRMTLPIHEKTWRNLGKTCQYKKLHTVWFQLYDILNNIKLYSKILSGLVIQRKKGEQTGKMGLFISVY